MARVSDCLRSTDDGYSHWCPGCHEMHYIAVYKPLSNGAQWVFDGELSKPTFSPSISIKVPGDEKGRIKPEHCHYFIKAGDIHFCSDSTHALAGQVVALPFLPEDT